MYREHTDDNHISGTCDTDPKPPQDLYHHTPGKPSTMIETKLTTDTFDYLTI